MLIIAFHNDGTGGEGMGNYNITVQINHKVIHSDRIENHDRSSGWEGLIQKYAKQLEVVQSDNITQ